MNSVVVDRGAGGIFVRVVAARMRNKMVEEERELLSNRHDRGVQGGDEIVVVVMTICQKRKGTWLDCLDEDFRDRERKGQVRDRALQ